MIGCDSGHVDLVDLLLMSGANPNAVDEAGMTPLHHTIPYSEYEPPEFDEPTAISMASRLLSAGADVSLCDSWDKTAADDAVKVGYKELAELLKCPDLLKKRRERAGFIPHGLLNRSDGWGNSTGSW
jgi:ankyrin repeat protein